MLPQGLVLHMDVKFPLDNYLQAPRRVERRRSASSAGKRVPAATCGSASARSRPRDYVDPGANTVDCVLLFIPNEQVYGFIQQQDRALLDDALRHKVVLCSPLTLFAVLAVIRQAVESFRISQSAQEVLALLQGFQKQWDKFVEQMDKVGRSDQAPRATRSRSSRARAGASSSASSTASTRSRPRRARTPRPPWRRLADARCRGRREAGGDESVAEAVGTIDPCCSSSSASCSCRWPSSR